MKMIDELHPIDGAQKLPRVWVAKDRIYADLGDGIVNFKNLKHMGEVRDVYRRVLKRGSIAGSMTFTADTMVQVKRRLENIVEAIVQVKLLKGMK